MGKAPTGDQGPRPLRFAPVLWRTLLGAAGQLPPTHPLAAALTPHLPHWRAELDAAQPPPLLSAAQVNTLIRAALHGTQASAQAPGIEIGGAQTLTAFGPAGFAMMTAPTVGEALHIGLRFQHLIGTPLVLRARPQGGELRLELRAGAALHADVERFLTEEFIASLLGILRQETGRDLRPLRTELTGPPLPLDMRLRYHAAFGTVSFGAPHSAVVWPAAWLTLPLLRADPATHRDALAWCERLTHAATPEPGEAFDAQVADCLRLQPPHDRDLGTVAALLGLHPRTVRHRLSRLDTTFRTVKTGVLLDEAREWLTHTPDSTEEIAQRLGFSDARSFRRALKAWTGHTPQELRQHAADDG
ncbi:AraC family transcriptional regulator ligand-binding domain-containing protein [Deinococcus sp. A31D244]|uniref:AraC family transcriptional regulator n=1 Tax=Deinococcus sp. A31D244 TaxID=3397675 RepID=UPI0039E0D6F1